MSHRRTGPPRVWRPAAAELRAPGRRPSLLLCRSGPRLPAHSIVFHPRPHVRGASHALDRADRSRGLESLRPPSGPGGRRRAPTAAAGCHARDVAGRRADIGRSQPVRAAGVDHRNRAAQVLCRGDHVPRDPCRGDDPRRGVREWTMDGRLLDRRGPRARRSRPHLVTARRQASVRTEGARVPAPESVGCGRCRLAVPRHRFENALAVKRCGNSGTPRWK